MGSNESLQDARDTSTFVPSTPDLIGVIRDEVTDPTKPENPAVERQPKEVWEDTPFAKLFAGAKPVESPSQPLPEPQREAPRNTTLEEKKGLLLEMKKQADIEREGIQVAKLEIRIDRAGILSIADKFEELFPPTRESSFDPERDQREYQEKLGRLRVTLEAIASLPEVIHFEPGLTILVGENGIGKSTLAKAIKYAAEVEDRARQLPFTISNVDDPIEPIGREEAIKKVLEPSRNMPDETTELFQAGLAPMIAEYMHVTELAHSAPGYRYYDPTMVMGEMNMYARDAGRGHSSYTSDGFNISREGEHARDGQSHRQTVDERLFGLIKRETQRAKERSESGRRGAFAHLHYGGAQVMFIDEPETGMSPRRHRQLANELLDVTPDGSIVVTPSNSIVLYESDVPRIDLEHPEWGIFRPSEHPGYFEEVAA